MKATKWVLAGIIMLVAMILAIGILHHNTINSGTELKPVNVRDTNEVSFTPTVLITDPLSIAVRFKN